jgi:NADH dehydrogenase [ubiquinone] 1 alpha subcomplex assembly factor 5
MQGSTPQIFDPARRMALRARALAMGAEQSFLLQHMADELSERLACVSRSFDRILLIGPMAALADRILPGRDNDVVAEPMLDEERLAFFASDFDLILSAGTLDSVNDLPGALVQIRRCLKPDGLFLGTLFGAGSLATLKAALLEADGAWVRAHVHPQIDLQIMSELMSRAGFALPVADIDALNVRYGSWRRLIADLRAAGIGNALAGPRGFARSLPERLDTAWTTRADANGKVQECFTFLQLSGWAPAASQPQPARRGSGTVSLADVLKKGS